MRGRHTARLQRDWAQRHDAIELELVRHSSPTAGLAEGLCAAAIVRRPVDEKRFDSLVVGLERRLVAFASDDPQWSRRRQLSMAEIADRTVIIDPRVGTTAEATAHHHLRSGALAAPELSRLGRPYGVGAVARGCVCPASQARAAVTSASVPVR